jgi:hypothetical protein
MPPRLVDTGGTPGITSAQSSAAALTLRITVDAIDPARPVRGAS